MSGVPLVEDMEERRRIAQKVTSGVRNTTPVDSVRAPDYSDEELRITALPGYKEILDREPTGSPEDIFLLPWMQRPSARLGGETPAAVLEASGPSGVVGALAADWDAGLYFRG